MNRFHLFYHKKAGLDTSFGHESIYNSNQGEQDLLVRMMQLLSEDADLCVVYGEDITEKLKEGLS